ncbi:amidoligase family protein [Oceanidesulfovibrio indonesiensis]|nr:amidoligase family protein [Oceanidesulfovibrio indonesiensis]
MPFTMPSVTNKSAGGPRHVGLELEFAGMDIRDAARAVADVFGGEVREVDTFICTVEGTTHGNFSVELDSSLLRSKGYLKILHEIGIDLSDANEKRIERILLDVADELIPYEVVAPPVPMTELAPMDDLRELLRRRKAKGTRASILYAFSMQFNVEPPDLTAPTLAGFLKAFLLCYPWLREASGLDMTRILSPFIDKFPSDYVKLVVDPAYQPCDEAALIDDYLDHNPTRNRPLDCMPIFAHLDRDRVMARANEKHLIKPRPAFHYRLPNCLIDEPAWRIAREWDLWVAVDDLSRDADTLAAMGEDFLNTPGFPLDLFTDSWKEKIPRWLDRS